MKSSFLLIWVLSALTVCALHHAGSSWLLCLLGGALAAVGLFTVWCGVWMGELLNHVKQPGEQNTNAFVRILFRNRREPE